jgi:hypothetical protein
MGEGAGMGKMNADEENEGKTERRWEPPKKAEEKARTKKRTVGGVHEPR